MTPASTDALLAADVERVAKGLTKAQRAALLAGQTTADDRVLVDAGPVLMGSHSTWPQGLCRYYSARLDALTPLGLAVRHHLTTGAAYHDHD